MIAVAPDSSLNARPAARPSAIARPAFAASLLAILGGQAACAAIALLTEICYARFLGPAPRGLISLCLMSIAFGTLLGGLGGEGTIVFWSSRTRDSDRSWLPAVIFWGLLGCLAATTLWILAYWRFQLPFLRGISPYSARLVLASIPVATLFAYTMALLSGAERFRLRSTCAFLRQLSGIAGFLVFLLFVGKNVETALWGNLLGILVGGLVALALLRETLRGFWKIGSALDSLKPTLSYGLRGHIGNLATFFTYRFDVFIVNYFLPPAQLGFYALAVVVSEVLWQIPQATASALFPRTARTQQDKPERFTCFVVRQVLLITCLGALLLALTCPLAIPLIFGRRFIPSIPAILWILPGTVALSLGKVAAADLAGRGKNGYSSIFALACFVITIALDWILIPRMGIIGAALASSIAYFANSLLLLLALRHELRVTWKDLLLPTQNDFSAYGNAWMRAKSSFTAFKDRRISLAAGFSLLTK